MSSGDRPRVPRTLYLVKRAETVIRSGLESCLQPLSVTPAQYVTLALLSEKAEQSSADLARRAGIAPQSISETIASLERKGLIERRENPEHRRILSTRLTDAGAKILAQCDVNVDTLEISLLAAFSPHEIELFKAMLRKIANIGRAER